LVLSVMVPLLKLNDTFKVLRGPTLVQKKKDPRQREKNRRSEGISTAATQTDSLGVCFGPFGWSRGHPDGGPRVRLGRTQRPTRGRSANVKK
jgi:hypothetical protein